MKNLNASIFESKLKKAKKLINSGSDINAKCELGIRPIITAINSDKPKTLKFVIENGADVNIDFGAPLHEIIDYCIDGMIQNQKDSPYPEHLEMLQILLDNGANLELSNPDNKRPIDVLLDYSRGNREYLEKLKSYFRKIIPTIDKLLP